MPILDGWVDEDLVICLPAEPCARCGKPTIIMSLAFEAHLHDTCSDEMWEEYKAACRASDLAHGKQYDPLVGF